MSQCCNTQPVCKHYMFTFHDVAQNRHLLTCLLTCNRSLNVAVISEEEKRKSKCCSSTTFWPSSFVSTRRKVSASNDRNFKRQSIGDTPRYSTIRISNNNNPKTDVRKIRESEGDFYIVECADEMNPGYLHVRLCCGNRSDLNLQQFDFETLLYSKYIAAG